MMMDMRQAMQVETIHITALTAAGRLHRAITLASEVVDAGATHDLSWPYKRDGVCCVDMTIYIADFSP